MKEDLMKALGEVKKKLKGRFLSIEEERMLRTVCGEGPLPVTLIEILKNYNLIGQTFSLTDIEDDSGLGVEMEWFTPEEQIEELLEFYPGKLLCKNEYFPIGKCLEGSGDPYFLQLKNDDYFVVRVPHDVIQNEEMQYPSIEFVCRLADLLNFTVGE